jgi:hypothetical protein
VPLATLLGEFAELLERHVRREERELFVRFAELVPEPDASGVGPEIQAILDARPTERRAVTPAPARESGKRP